jgi:RNA polymerase sigma factor (sigma-70 family)
MATAAMVMKDMHRLFDGGTVAGLSDAELLEGFLARRDEEAFAALVSRHGAMVLGTCRAVLHDAGAVEDVFQATFLVLARKAGSVRGRDALGGWLHRVAFRAAVQANKASARRRLEERKAAEMRATTATSDEARDDLRALIHAEVERLPEALRLPVVLCDLGGMSREQAAAELRWTEGTVRGRLARGRAKLKTRLARHGVAPTVATLAAAMAREATAAVPGAWIAATARPASASLAGKAAAGASAAIAAGVIRAMLVARVKVAAGLVLALGMAAGATAGLMASGLGPREAGPAPVAAIAPAAEPVEGSVTYHGRVLGPDGKPFEGARITLRTADEPGKVPPVRARSGGDGRFRFEVAKSEFKLPANLNIDDIWRQVSVVASADELGPDWASFAGVDARGREPGLDGGLTLRLVEPGPPVEGRVLDLQGRPVAGATVHVERIEATTSGGLDPFLRGWRLGNVNAETILDKILFDPDLAGLPATVTADAQGLFRIAGVGRDRGVRLRVSGPGVEEGMVRALTREGLTTKELAAVGPETEMFMGKTSRGLTPLHGPKFDALLGPARTLDGVVREAGTGRPIAGVRVNGAGEGHPQHVEAVSDDRGRFRINGLPVAAPIRLNFYPKDGQTYLPASKVVTAREGAGPLSAEVEMSRGVTAVGKVVDRATGKPVKGLIIYQPLAGNAAFRDTPAGEWVLHNVNAESTGGDGSFRVPVGPGPGVILVQIQNPRGPGLSTEYLPVRRDPNDGAPGFGGSQDMLTGAANQAIPLSLYQAYALIDPKPGDAEVTCELKVERGASKAGTVLDPAGKPLAGAVVAGLGGIFDGPKTVAGSEFTARLIDPARPRYLMARHAAGNLAGAVAIKGDGPVELKLEPAAALTGRLIDADGRPIAGARVGVGYRGEKDVATPTTSGRPQDERILTDRDGRFRVEGLIAGLKTMLWASKDGRPLQAGAAFEGIGLRAGEAKDLGDVTAGPFQ